jgi:hypothetical protein
MSRQMRVLHEDLIRHAILPPAKSIAADKTSTAFTPEHGHYPRVEKGSQCSGQYGEWAAGGTAGSKPPPAGAGAGAGAGRAATCHGVGETATSATATAAEARYASHARPAASG